MLHAYKIEINPTKEQALKIRQGVGVCRWVYNNYIAKNQELHAAYENGELSEDERRFFSAIDFDKFVNHEIKTREEFAWVNECGSKARKQAAVDANMAFNKFFTGEGGFPKFKRKGKNDPSMYFPKNNKGDWTVWRHKIQIPTIGIVKFKEYGYIPIEADVKSGRVSFENGRYYVSVLADVDPFYANGKSKNKKTNVIAENQSEGQGLDFGIKNTVVSSNGKIYPNINKESALRRLSRIKKRIERGISRKDRVRREGTPTSEFIPPTDKNGKRIETIASKTKKIIKEVKKLGGKENRDNKRRANREVREYIKEQKRKAQQDAAAKALEEAQKNETPLPNKINGKRPRRKTKEYKAWAKQKKAEFKALPKDEQKRILRERAEQKMARKKQKTEIAKAKRKNIKAFQVNKSQFKKKSSGFYKNLRHLHSVQRRINNIKEDYQNKIVRDVIKQNPAYISIEDLGISRMMKNKYLANALLEQALRELRTKFELKCLALGIELRIVSRTYPSSKKCHECGNVKPEMPLSQRTYDCECCGHHADRDFNAALNLRDTDQYLRYEDYVEQRKKKTALRKENFKKAKELKKSAAGKLPSAQSNSKKNVA